MDSQGHSQHCALVEKGGKCCEGLKMPKSGSCVLWFGFGALVIVCLAVMIVMQAKTLKVLKKMRKK